VTSHPFEVDYAALEFVDKIGEGAFAEVWRGSWLQGPVAIKRFRTAVSLSVGGASSGGSDDDDGPASGGSAGILRAKEELLGSAAAGAGAGDGHLMRYASKILSDDDGGRLSRRVTQSALRRFMSDASREKYTAFLNEVNLMNKLRHPNVMMYMGAVVNPRSPLCIVCELFEGGSLHEYLHRDRAFRPARGEALGIALAVARGMNYLHSRSPPFLHRDLKPRNVLLSSVTDAKPHVVICDFGLCKLFGDDDGDAAAGGAGLGVMGTASYMSPSVIDGRSGYTTADDVYSFGLVLWEVCTGRVPFEGMKPIQVIFQVSEDGLRPDLGDGDDLPPALRALIAECWHENPSLRPTFVDVTLRLDALAKQPEAAARGATSAAAGGSAACAEAGPPARQPEATRAAAGAAIAINEAAAAADAALVRRSRSAA
jgi:serine/threonine protein kinase